MLNGSPGICRASCGWLEKDKQGDIAGEAGKQAADKEQ